jgi:hypothetical protein
MPYHMSDQSPIVGKPLDESNEQIERDDLDAQSDFLDKFDFTSFLPSRQSDEDEDPISQGCLSQEVHRWLTEHCDGDQGYFRSLEQVYIGVANLEATEAYMYEPFSASEETSAASARTDTSVSLARQSENSHTANAQSEYPSQTQTLQPSASLNSTSFQGTHRLPHDLLDLQSLPDNNADYTGPTTRSMRNAQRAKRGISSDDQGGIGQSTVLWLYNEA